MSEQHVRFVYREVLKGMKSMHELGILHRDIKNANILLHMPKINPSQGGFLHGNGQKLKGSKLIRTVTEMLDTNSPGNITVAVKLGDFGFATTLGQDEMIKFYCGTPLNMAPEILNDQFYNHKVDVWSLGVALFEAIFRQPPFTGRDQTELIENINTGII